VVAGDAPDDPLLAAVGRGDAQAFRALVARHADRLHAVALRTLGDAAEAEDVTQEVLTRLWQQAPRWRPGAAQVATWLHRVAVNACLDRLRRARHRRHAPLEAADAVPDTAPGIETRLVEGERARAVRAAVAGLPDRQRMALALTYAGGLSNAAVAEAMALSVGAVESLLVRAKRELRARLTVAGGEG
jgi:RNA polymerase sigma-70 factor (ECF subfamily)